MSSQEADKLFTRGLNALGQGRTLTALSWFEKALAVEDHPVYRSYFAYCIAKERGQFKKAVSLCETSIDQDPGNSAHYLNLGKVRLITGDKDGAVKAFRDGLSHEQNAHITRELDKLSARKPSVVPFLERDNPLNRYVGFVLTKLRLR